MSEPTYNPRWLSRLGDGLPPAPESPTFEHVINGDSDHPLTLTDFLLARIAEDEDVPKAAAANALYDGAEEAIYTGDDPWPSHLAFAERFTPARVLAECDAKRGAIESAWRDHSRIEDEWGYSKGRDSMSAEDDNPAVIEWLALPYADHPDYREEWKP